MSSDDQQEEFTVTSYLQSITSQDPFSDYSFEELRLNDDKSGVTGMIELATALYKDELLPPLPTTDATGFEAEKPAVQYGASIITFKVGRSWPRNFAIHESVVCRSSAFVRSAMHKGWKEADDREIPLPDEEPSVFEVYQNWLYERKIYSVDWTESYRTLVKSYIFGDKLVDYQYKNAVIHAIIQKLRDTSLFDLGLTNLIYDNTPPESPLRRLLRDIYAWLGNSSWCDDEKLEEDISS